MRVPWIRVHGGLYDRPVVTRLCAATGIKEHEAIGLLVTFWSNVSQHAENGRVAEYPDAQLEKWARWEKKRGAFAKWLRAEHLDEDGRVKEWDEYAGRLERIREHDRQRKASGKPKEFQRNSSGIPAEGNRNSVATRANETRRDETEREKEKSSSSSAQKNAQPETAKLRGRALFLERMAQLSISRRDGMEATLDKFAEGYGLPIGFGIPTPAQIDQACDDVLATCELGSLNVLTLTEFMARVMRPTERPAKGRGRRSFVEIAEERARRQA